MCIMVFISLIVKLGVGNFFIVISCINYMYIIIIIIKCVYDIGFVNFYIVVV